MAQNTLHKCPKTRYTSVVHLSGDGSGNGHISCVDTHRMYGMDVFVHKLSFKGPALRTGEQIRFAVQFTRDGLLETFGVLRFSPGPTDFSYLFGTTLWHEAGAATATTAEGNVSPGPVVCGTSVSLLTTRRPEAIAVPTFRDSPGSDDVADIRRGSSGESLGTEPPLTPVRSRSSWAPTKCFSPEKMVLPVLPTSGLALRVKALAQNRP